jgi:hypothetical protein
VTIALTNSFSPKSGGVGAKKGILRIREGVYVLSRSRMPTIAISSEMNGGTK